MVDEATAGDLEWLPLWPGPGPRSITAHADEYSFSMHNLCNHLSVKSLAKAEPAAASSGAKRDAKDIIKN